MDPLNPFANAWDDDKTPQNDGSDDAWTPASTSRNNANTGDVTGSHAVPSWSSQPEYDQDPPNIHADTYATESPAWQPASPVWQASSSPVFDREEPNSPQFDDEAITLPSATGLSSVVAEPVAGDNDDWGQMALPKSRWEEELHKPPVWEPEGKGEPKDLQQEAELGTSDLHASGDGWANEDIGNEDDPWGAKGHTSASSKRNNDGEEPVTTSYGDSGEPEPVVDSRYHGGTPPESPSSSSFAGRDFAPVKSSDIEKRKRAKDALEASRSSNTSAEDEDALRVLAELGIPVRNLDQEENAAKPAATTGRWSLFGGRKITPTAAQLESSRASLEAGAGQAAAKMSASMDVIREKAAAVNLPRLSSSSSTASPADPSAIRTGTPPLTPGETATSATFAQRESKWFRFGAKKPAISSPTTSDTRPASAGSNNPPSSTTTASTSKAPMDILDDFGQLENFDSRLAAPTGATSTITVNAKNSGQTSRYDSSSLSSYHRDDLVIDKPSWSFWSGRAAPASHSALGKNGIVEHANDGEAELDNIFEAFEAAPKKVASSSNTKLGDAVLFDGSSQKTREVAPDLVGLDDPYSVLGVGSSRTAPAQRTSTAKDLDPLDPLSASVSAPPPKPVSRIPSGPISPLAPPSSTLSLSNSISRPSSVNSVVKPLAPPPRLAPPPPSAGLRKTPSPASLIDDFGDFAVSPTASAAQSSATPQPHNQVPSVSKANDDFGDFEAFAISPSSTQPTVAVTASPKKAVGPMKLASHKPPALGSSTGSLSQQDLSFFDSL